MAATTFHLPKASNQQQNDLAAERDRSQRSVFVGNIPYEATDENLREIFSQAGPVLSFRLVYDRESGKPKGYGFCEYKDVETAQSAMRNLNGVELHGRNLRVDSAASEKGKDEGKDIKPEVSPYGAEVPSKEAPEAISQAVASLPPEQMFELMKQMKMCIQNNPDEARQMLLQNPQLAYALLQAQVIMKIVDPKVALAILHQPRSDPLPTGNMPPPPTSGPSGIIPSSNAPVSGPGPAPVSSGASPVAGMSVGPGGRPRGPGDVPPAMGHQEGWRPPDDVRPDVDMQETMKREFRGPPPMDSRGPPGSEIRGPPVSEMMDPREFRGPPMDRDDNRGRDGRGPPPDNEFREFREERFRDFGGPGGPPFEMRDREMRDHGGPMMDRGPIDPRERGAPPGIESRDPRMRGDNRNPNEQRGPPGPRGPDGRVPGDLRPAPDSRDGWVPPDRRGPIDPRSGEPRSSPRDDRPMREGRGPPPDIREPRDAPMDPRAQAGPRGDSRRGPPFDRWSGPPDPRGIPPEHRGPPGERRGMPERRGPPEQRNDPRYRSGSDSEFFEGRPNAPGTPNAADGPPRGPGGPGGAKPTGLRDENSPFQQW